MKEWKWPHALVVACVLVAFMALVLSGCKEGRNNVPISALLEQPTQAVHLAHLGSPTYSLVGIVKGQSSRQPLGNIGVRLTHSGRPVSATRTTSEGRFFFPNLPSALYDLLIGEGDPQYASTTFVVRILPGGSMSPPAPEVFLQEKISEDPSRRRFSIVGRLKTNTTPRAPIAHEVVRVLDASNQELGATISSLDGTFVLSPVLVGTYTLETAYLSSSFQRRTLPIRITQEGTIIPFPTLFLDAIHTERRSTIQGVVRSRDDPVSLLRIRLLGTSPVDKHTTADGRFFFENMPSGFYKIAIDPNEERYTSQIIGVQVLPDGSVIPAIAQVRVFAKQIPVVTYVASGTITDAFTGGPLEYVVCNLRGHGNFLTDRDGRFVFPGLVPGSYHIEFSKLGFNTLVVAFSIDQSGSFLPRRLDYYMIYSPETNKGSIAGRYVDPVTQGVPVGRDLWVQLYEYARVTQATATPHGFVEETGYHLVSSPEKYTRFRKSSDPNFNREGTFKFTHLDPNTRYLVYIGNVGSNVITHLASSIRHPGVFFWVRENTTNASRTHSWHDVSVQREMTTFVTNYEPHAR